MVKIVKKIVKNGQNWPTCQNWSKIVKMVKKIKRSKMVKNGKHGWHNKIVKSGKGVNGPKWSKWSKIVKRVKMAKLLKNGQKGQIYKVQYRCLNMSSSIRLHGGNPCLWQYLVLISLYQVLTDIWMDVTPKYLWVTSGELQEKFLALIGKLLWVTSSILDQLFYVAYRSTEG